MKNRHIILAVVMVILCSVVYTVHLRNLIASAEDSFATVYAMCKPGSRVNVRRTPGGKECGYLEAGDWVETDGTVVDNWLRCYGVGEYGECWIWLGYVSTEEPQKIGKTYRVASNGRVIIRKYMNGPKVDGKSYLVNGSIVQVFMIGDGWACTNRGYIKAEYLEADP